MAAIQARARSTADSRTAAPVSDRLDQLRILRLQCIQLASNPGCTLARGSGLLGKVVARLLGCDHLFGATLCLPGGFLPVLLVRVLGGLCRSLHGCKFGAQPLERAACSLEFLPNLVEGLPVARTLFIELGSDVPIAPPAMV